MTALRLAFRIALRNLALRKGRAALMMAGVAVGIITLTLVTAVTRGTGEKVERGIQAFGPDAVMIAAGSPQTRGPGDERVTTLVPGDLEAIRTAVPGIRVIVPLVTRTGQTVVAGDRNTTVTVFAAPPGLEEAWDMATDQGELISEAHEASLARVAVLGPTVARELFGADEPVGQSIRLGEQKFKVVGLARAKGTSAMGMDMDNRVYIPLSTGMRRLYNVDHYSLIRFRLAAEADMAAVIAQVTTLLRERHGIAAGQAPGGSAISPADTDDFVLRSAIAFRQMAAKMSRTLTLLLGIITLVALGAGALVLGNILTVAVNERRAEIGVRRAVGATRRQITQQFLLEGVVVTVLGGLTGIALGAGVVLVLGRATELPVALSWHPFVLGFLVTLGVGLVASWLPARRAALLSVADALRP